MRSETLRIAVSSQNLKTVTGHAGRCRRFWIYEIRENRLAGRTLCELTPEQTLHSAPLAERHPLAGVHVMITANVTPFLYQRLARAGIRPFVTDEPDPDKALRMLLEKVAGVKTAPEKGEGG
jgi:predicted Fe-Mo cluster-binding NifX family protein